MLRVDLLTDARDGQHFLSCGSHVAKGFDVAWMYFVWVCVMPRPPPIKQTNSSNFEVAVRACRVIYSMAFRASYHNTMLLSEEEEEDKGIVTGWFE
jgi:hypothetical protein